MIIFLFFFNRWLISSVSGRYTIKPASRSSNTNLKGSNKKIGEIFNELKLMNKYKGYPYKLVAALFLFLLWTYGLIIKSRFFDM